MQLPGYILRIAPIVVDPPKIDEDTMTILLLFAVGSPLSVYKIRKILKNANYKISSPGILKKIKKLKKMNLIELSKLKSQKFNKNESRGAIYYKLSEEGIFLIHNDYQFLAKPNQYYIMTNLKERKFPGPHLFYEKGIYRTHPNCALFTIFLNPWISMDTVNRSGPRIIRNIRRFLVNCCRFLRVQIKILNEIFPLVFMEKEKLAESEYFSFDDLKPGIIKSKVFPLSQILKESFNLETEALKLDRVDRNFFNISDLNNNLLYQLLYKENESELEIVSAINKEDRITLKGNSNREILTPRIGNIHDAIISEYELHLDEMIFNISMHDIDSNDFLLLKSDSRFSHKLTETKDKFLKKYELFTE